MGEKVWTGMDRLRILWISGFLWTG